LAVDGRQRHLSWLAFSCLITIGHLGGGTGGHSQRLAQGVDSVLHAMDVDLESVIPQAAAGGDKADRARLIYCGQRPQIEADSADGHCAEMSPALVNQFGAAAAELAYHADPHTAVIARPLVPDQEAAASAAVARHAQLLSAQKWQD
jgi:hypothetical protein